MAVLQQMHERPLVVAAIGTDFPSSDADGGQTSGIFVGVAHRGQRTAAIDITVYLSAGNADGGVAGYLAGSDAVGGGTVVVVGVNATATTIDITAVDGGLRDGTREIVQLDTDTSAIDVDVRIIQDMAVLAATEDGAIDPTIIECH